MKTHRRCTQNDLNNNDTQHQPNYLIPQIHTTPFLPNISIMPKHLLRAKTSSK